MGQCLSSKPSSPAVDGSTTTPCVLVIVGPSGVGKGTLISALMTTVGIDLDVDRCAAPRLPLSLVLRALLVRQDDPSPYAFSVSHTTRSARPGEKDGVHYHFTTKGAFEADIADGKFIEHAHVHDNIYGTSFAAVEQVQNDNKCCILDIDVQGARQVKASSLKSMIVFIAPPDVAELEKRLRGRGTETEEQIKVRTANARAEMDSVQRERTLYDAVLTNDDFRTCLGELRAVAAKALEG